MDKNLILNDAVKNCVYIPKESKPIFISNLHSSIELYKNKLRHEKLLYEQFGISVKDDLDKADNFCAKLKDGIKTAKKLKLIVGSIDQSDSVLISALNEFVNNAEINLKIEQPKRSPKGRQANQNIHALGLSFKSVWELHATVDVENPEAIQIATLFFYEAGILKKPDSPLDHNEKRNTVSKLFRHQLNGKSKVIPYLQVVKAKE